MACLVACLGSDTENWESIIKIINSKLFSNIYLITDDYGIKNFSNNKYISGYNVNSFIKMDFKKPVDELMIDIYVALKKKFSENKILELDIAVNISSGTGKEHTAIISAITKLGMGIRLIEVDSKGEVIEL